MKTQAKMMCNDVEGNCCSVEMIDNSFNCNTNLLILALIKNLAD